MSFSSLLTSQNQSAVAGSGSDEVNPFFQTNRNSSWVPWILEGAQSVLQTNALGDSITFTVQSSVGFAIYGTTALAYGAYNVSIDPAPAGLPATAQYNASTAFEVLGALKYLATGLDDAQTYTVTVTNAEANKSCDIGQVVLHSAAPAYVLFLLEEHEVVNSGYLQPHEHDSMLEQPFKHCGYRLWRSGKGASSFCRGLRRHSCE